MVEDIVKFFDHGGGYGFITGDPSGHDMFVHSTTIEMDRYRYLATGELVLCEFEHVAASDLQEDGKADLALVVDCDPDGRTHPGNTVLTLDMAYSNARLLDRPDRDWLRLGEDAPTSGESK